ncbi:hypothetical protein MKX03_014635 [Papaver bracteatum]|nr:hypothetical protein MKX03_014635 [Papaver bracteatum]
MTKVSTDNWILMPECGFIIIAETFSTVVHYIGKGISYTFAPTTVKMVTKIKNRKVVMGFVEGKHFIGLKLSGNFPLPPEPSLGYWKDVKNPVAEEWLAQYGMIISQWNYLDGLQRQWASDNVYINVEDD